MKLILILCVFFSCVQPVCAYEITAPPVPDSGAIYMPKDTESFGEALWQMICDAVTRIRPDISEVTSVCVTVLVLIMLTAIIARVPGGNYAPVNLVGVASIAVILLSRTNTLIHLGSDTVRQLNEYGKLLLPVMTSALAAQGLISSSTALYTGTAIFNSVLCGAISTLLIPMVYLYLSTSISGSFIGEEMLMKLSGGIKSVIVWCLRTILYVFTGYMGITGVVSGGTDAAALKAAKLTISGFVPVVGGILSDASEAVLVGAGIVKNAAGIYGILAVMAVFIGPFIKIGTHYLLLKATGTIGTIIGTKQCVSVIDHFTAAMGLLLAMTGSVCLLLLISTVCFIKGVG